MGMDIMLYEVEKKKEDCQKEYLYNEDIEKPIEHPSWLDKYIFFAEEEAILLDKIAEDFGQKLEDMVETGWDEKGNSFHFADGTAINLSDEELKHNYTKTVRVPAVCVKEIDYTRYGYTGDLFSEGNHPLSGKLDNIVPFFIWDPHEMDKLTYIFKYPSEWIRIKERFQKEIDAGNHVFVYISW